MQKFFLAFFVACVCTVAGCSGDKTSPEPGSGNPSVPNPTSVPLPPSPSPTLSPEPTTTLTLFEGFEDGWGHFLDGGEYSSLSSESSYAGINSAKLEGDHGASSSVILRKPMDLSNAQSLTLNFWMFGQNLADGDALKVDYSDGTKWVTVAYLVKGIDFGNGQYSNVVIDLAQQDYDFSRSARIRVTSETQANPIFVDDVSVATAVYEADPGAGSGDNGSDFEFDHSTVNDGCQGCHNNLIAEGKSASHIDTSDECQFCHIANSSEAWLAFTYFSGSFDHTNIAAGCVSCHNEGLTRGKGPLHIDSSNDCEQCHSPTRGWDINDGQGGFAHIGINSGCVSCHDGGVARGKHDTHIVSTDNCENCHTPNVDWTITTGFDHSGIVDNCVSCHNGDRARGKHPFHIPSSDSCESCHSPDNGWWLDGIDVFDHGTIVTGCVACHNGSIVSGKFSNHIPSGDACENCHLVGGKWNEVVTFSHEGITDNCVSCHNGTQAEGKDPFHIASSDNCESCHLPDQGWLIAIGPGFTHQNIVAGCLSCHNNALAAGKGPDHIPSNDRCEVCHTVGSNWSVEVFTHDGIISECATCHNGTTATGKSIDHVPSPNLCESCHLPNRAWAFELIQPFSHTGISTSCLSCHNNDLVGGKGADHVPSSDQCESCHNTSGSWTDAKFSHVGITSNCVSCHNGFTAAGKSPGHIASSNACETCHQPEDNWLVQVVDNFDHLNVNANCSTCHDDGIASGKSTDHIPSDSVCENCHEAGGQWTDAVFNHDGIEDGCSSCHNGSIATGTSENHFNTTFECVSCHLKTAWEPVYFAHGKPSYPGDHSRDIACTTCHSENSHALPWPFDYPATCAGCHANDYQPGPHGGASVSDLRNCAGSCHIASPQHSVSDNRF